MSGRLRFGSLAPRDRRAILLGLIVLAPALLWMGVVRPYRALLGRIAERTSAEAGLLAREQTLLTQAGALPEELRGAQQVAERTAKRLVRAANVPLAAAALSDYLESTATRSHVLIQEMRDAQLPRSAAKPGGLRPMRLAIRGESDLNGVTAFLHQLEEGQMLVRTLELSLEPVLEKPRPQSSRTSSQSSRVSSDTRRPAALPAQPTGVMQFMVLVEAYAPPESAPEHKASPSEVSS